MNTTIDLERCIEVFLSQYKKSTQISYTRALTDMSRHLGPANHPEEFTPLDLLEYIGKVKNRDYAPATVNKYIKTVKVFFNWCLRMGFIEASPVANVQNMRVPQKINRNKAMQHNEFDQIMEYFRHQLKFPNGPYRWRDYACFLFLSDTGCRRGGISTLTIDRIDTINRVATVHEKGKIRDVYFGEECARAIDHWINEAKRKGIASEWVFSTNGRQWQATAVSQMIRRTAKRAGVKQTRSSHSIRHMVGQRYADNAVNPKIAKEVLGHSDVEITIKNYYDTTDEQIRREVERFAYRSPIKEKIHIFNSSKKKSS